MSLNFHFRLFSNELTAVKKRQCYKESSKPNTKTVLNYIIYVQTPIDMNEIIKEKIITKIVECQNFF